MHILVPEHISADYRARIKQISADIQISTLKIVVQENVIQKIVRKLASYCMPYPLYRRVVGSLKAHKEYSFYINEKKLSAPERNIDALLATWVITKDIFEALIEYLPDLKWVHATKTGYDEFDQTLMAARQIVFTNTKNAHSARIAEFVMACMLEVSKRISTHISLTKKRRWMELKSDEIAGKTISILGIGNIGTEIAKRAMAFQMRVIGYDSIKKASDYFDATYTADDIGEVLAQADFLVICMPLTPQTKNFLNKEKIAYLKKSAYVINVGRSEIIDEDDLIDALRNKKIRGAILDVFHPDMRLRNHPYYKFSNVILTHYSAHASRNSLEEIFAIFLKELRQMIQGRYQGDPISTPK